jgi:quinoprotein glucose dehydrogenase
MRIPEVRAQAVKTFGDFKNPGAKAISSMLALLKDPSARVRSFAAIALGNAKAKGAVPEIVEQIRGNQDQDAALRHALCAGLAGCADAQELIAMHSDMLGCGSSWSRRRTPTLKA